MADAYNRLADSQYYTSDFAGAAATYEKAFHTNPEAGDYPIYQQGVMKGLRRDYKGKIETLSDMIARFPQSALVPSALLGMGESYGEMGNNARAIETYATPPQHRAVRANCCWPSPISTKTTGQAPSSTTRT